MTWCMIVADCIEAMAEMEEASVDAVVTDPPYLLSFMGKPWDEQLDHKAWGYQALRVLKPGGHLLAFGGTRTYHRLACALEDAGFEIRDCLAWLYGSGFPKSLDVSKAIDKAAGAERTEQIGPPSPRRPNSQEYGDSAAFVDKREQGKGFGPHPGFFAPATPDAERWQGWGTALKPAFEPIVLARKPLGGTVAANVLEHGTGALNIDGTRIGTDEDRSRPPRTPNAIFGNGKGTNLTASESDPAGRWPANVLLDEQAAAMLDEQSGEQRDGATRIQHGFRQEYVNGQGEDAHLPPAGYGSGGGASRFFYTAKTSRAERNRGLEHRVAATSTDEGYGSIQTPNLERSTPRENWQPHKVANNHPTVKPVDLMQWLCRLVTPPGGLILDPFAGSGTTGLAALREGFDFIGIEREADYVEIARDRIIGDAPLFNVTTESALEGTDQ